GVVHRRPENRDRQTPGQPRQTSARALLEVPAVARQAYRDDQAAGSGPEFYGADVAVGRLQRETELRCNIATIRRTSHDPEDLCAQGAAAPSFSDPPLFLPWHAGGQPV